MKLYLYCLIDDDVSVENVIFTGPNEGISGSPVTLHLVDDFALLANDFAGASVPVTRENVLKHAEVVGSLLPVTTPLPFRFGTLATEEKLESFLSSRSQALLAMHALVRGCVEMNVKIIWNRQWTEEPPAAEPGKPGTAFLAEKRRELLGSATRAEEAKKIARWLGERVGDAVRQTELKTDFTSKLLVTAAHLVPRELVDEYRTRVKNAQLERPEPHFLVSGPWPPYSFANIDLEFKTHFGVS